MIVRASDGEGGRVSLVVRITITDIGDPPATPPSQVVIVPGNPQLTMRWNAVYNEVGKPPVSGYEVVQRPGDKCRSRQC